MPEPALNQRASGTAAGASHHEGRASGKEDATRILVLNPKGGCGKTTIATNLACWYAHAGLQVSLMDHDAQGSSTHWLALRPHTLPAIHSIPAFRHESPGLTRAFQFRLPFDTARVIIDTPAGAPSSEVRRLLRLADVVVVPVLPSPIDMHAVESFLEKLERERADRPIALVANRLRANTLGTHRLQHYLEHLALPLVATLHDLQAYVHCAESGRGLHDIDLRGMQREREELCRLAAWIDAGGRLEESEEATAESPAATDYDDAPTPPDAIGSA